MCYDENKIILPNEFNFYKKWNIILKEINCGISYVVCKDINDNIFTWGVNESGQCGTNKTSFRISKKPHKILFKCNVKIKKIECGSFHTILIDYNDNIWSFGCNCCYECLLMDEEHSWIIRTPIFIPKEKIFKKLDIQFDSIVRVIGDYHETFFVFQ